MGENDQEIGLELHKIRRNKKSLTVIKWLCKHHKISHSALILLRNTVLVFKSNFRRAKALKAGAGKVYGNCN